MDTMFHDISEQPVDRFCQGFHHLVGKSVFYWPLSNLKMLYFFDIVIMIFSERPPKSHFLFLTFFSIWHETTANSKTSYEETIWKSDLIFMIYQNIKILINWEFEIFQNFPMSSSSFHPQNKYLMIFQRITLLVVEILSIFECHENDIDIFLSLRGNFMTWNFIFAHTLPWSIW